MIHWLISVGVAGEMFVGGGTVPPGDFDGRELTFQPQAFSMPAGFWGHWAMTYNRSDGFIYSCYGYEPPFAGPDEFRYVRWDRNGSYLDVGLCPFGVPGVAFTSSFYNPLTGMIEDSGQNFPREWLDPLEMAVGWNGFGLEGLRSYGTVLPIPSAQVISRLVRA